MNGVLLCYGMSFFYELARWFVEMKCYVKNI